MRQLNNFKEENKNDFFRGVSSSLEKGFISKSDSENGPNSMIKLIQTRPQQAILSNLIRYSNNMLIKQP